MSERGRTDSAFPRSEITDTPYQILKFCGGLGGGGCYVVLGATQYVYPIRVSKFLTFNRSLLLANKEFIAIDIFTDGGPDGFFCSHTPAVRVPWWLGFSATGVLTDSEVKAQNIQISTAPPHEILVNWNKLPQPTLLGGGVNPDWESRIYVHIVWDSPLYVMQTEFYEGILSVIKHDYDVKI